jgi:hypothetical protein
MNALEVGQHLIDVGTFHLHRGRSGCGAYRLQSRSRGIFAFKDHDIQRRARHVRHLETGDPGGLPGARQDIRLDVLSTCVDLISLSALTNHNCVHRLLLFRT